MNYQLHYAINLRELTYLDWLGTDAYHSMPPAEVNNLIGFKESIQIAANDGHSEYQPDIAYEVMVGEFNRYGTSYRKATKKQWYINYRAWRKYMSQADGQIDSSITLVPN